MSSQFSSYSTKEIQHKIKKQQTFVIVKIAVVLLMLILAILATLEDGISALTFLPLFFLPMLFVMINELKKLKKELAART